MARDLERVISGSAGSFLCPPGHPNYSYKVETDCNRHKKNRGSMSISYAAQDPHVALKVRLECNKLLSQYRDNRPATDTDEVREWISQVLQYFKNCYVADNGSRNVSDLIIDSALDPVLNANRHAGVAYIRDHYPDFTPTAEMF